MAGKKLPIPTKQYRLVLSCRPGEDDDLIEFLDSLAARTRSRTIKRLLRQGGGVAHLQEADQEELNEFADSFDDFLL